MIDIEESRKWARRELQQNPDYSPDARELVIGATHVMFLCNEVERLRAALEVEQAKYQNYVALVNDFHDDGGR